jgi:hypothetical protein
VGLHVVGLIPSTRPRKPPLQTCLVKKGYSTFFELISRVSNERIDHIETRPGELTTRVAAVERDLAAMKVDHAPTQLRLDSMDRRIERIEKRRPGVNNSPASRPRS